MATIHIENLKKKYGNVEALRGIDLEISNGGIIGILGPNGAGKTTLVEIIEGLRMPTSGKVSVLGMDPQKSFRQLKEKIGVQLQTTSLPQELTVREILKLFASFYKKARPVDEILHLVQLESKADARNRMLSGGQRQRLAIGLALINDPEIVILDEPTTGLDPVARRSLHSIIERFRNQGKTILLTTHYIEEAEKLCNRVIVINQGHIVADGTPFELVNRSSGATTVWIALEQECDLSPLLQSHAVPQGREGEYHRFLTSNPAETIIALGELLKSSGVALKDFRMKRPTLEDVYLELIGQLSEEELKTMKN